MNEIQTKKLLELLEFLKNSPTEWHISNYGNSQVNVKFQVPTPPSPYGRHHKDKEVNHGNS